MECNFKRFKLLQSRIRYLITDFFMYLSINKPPSYVIPEIVPHAILFLNLISSNDDKKDYRCTQKVYRCTLIEYRCTKIVYRGMLLTHCGDLISSNGYPISSNGDLISSNGDMGIYNKLGVK